MCTHSDMYAYVCPTACTYGMCYRERRIAMFAFASVHTTHGVVVTSITTATTDVMDDMMMVVGGTSVATPMRPRVAGYRGHADVRGLFTSTAVTTHNAWDRDRR